MQVFVYGTLKPGESNYQTYCDGKVIETQRVYTFGLLYHLPLAGYPAMTLGEGKVEGVLLTFSDETVLEQLDRLEDYHHTRSPKENLYQRQKTLVYNLAEEPLGEVWSYIMSLDKVRQLGGVIISSGCWTQIS